MSVQKAKLTYVVIKVQAVEEMSSALLLM